MIVMSLATIAYAALAGPALEFTFGGGMDSILRTPEGDLRAAWQLFPGDWLNNLDAMKPTEGLWILPVAIVTIAVFKGVGQTGQFFLFGRISQQAMRKIRSDLFGSLMRQSAGFYDHHKQGDLLSRLNNDTTVVEQAVFYGLGSLLRDTLAVVGLLAYMIYSDATLSLWTIVIVPTAVLPLLRFAKWLKRVAQRSQVAQGEIQAVSHEALAGHQVVRAFGNEHREQVRMHGALGRHYDEMLRSYFIRAIRTPTMEILGAVGLALLIALLGYYSRSQGADAAHYMSFLSAIFFMYDPLKKLGHVSDYLAAGSAAAERVFEILDTPAAVRDRPGAQPIPDFNESVRFRNISFGYEPERLVLNQFDLEIRKGAVIALVGPSGGGKTTIAHLLARFYDIQDQDSGSVEIDGRDIRDFTQASLRRQIAIVSQETFLFNTSIADNIAYGIPNASRQQVEKAAQAACADEFIQQLPQGYDTVVGDRGGRLSGGERQRVAIARALLKDAPLLILDEATSHLDAASESSVQQALTHLMKDRTSLVIAHRLSTVQRADEILVITRGRIEERGVHENLVERGGPYAELYQLQFSASPSSTTISSAP